MLRAMVPTIILVMIVCAGGGESFDPELLEGPTVERRMSEHKEENAIAVEGTHAHAKHPSLVHLVLDADLMVDTFGFAPPPLYAISVKGYCNFFVGIIFLIGLKLTATKICPFCFNPIHYNAFTGEAQADQSSRYMELGSEEEADDHVEKWGLPLRSGQAFFPGDDMFEYMTRVLAMTLDARAWTYTVLRVKSAREASESHGVTSKSPVTLIRADIPGQEQCLLTVATREVIDQLPGQFVFPANLLQNCTYVETVSSAFLARFTLKPLSIGFQAIGIFTSAYATFAIWHVVPVKTWDDWQILAYLLSQHSSMTTLAVATSQTFTMAVYSQTDRDKLIGSVLFAVSAIVGLPSFMAAMTVAWDGIWLFMLFPTMIGLSLLPLAAMLMVVTNMVENLQFVANARVSHDYPVPECDGRSAIELRSTYNSKSTVGKTWFFLTYLLPRTAIGTGYIILLVVACLMIALLIVPLSWLCVSGLDAVPVAGAFLLEVIVPLFGIVVFSAMKLAHGVAANMCAAGMVMVLGFVIAQAVVSFTSVLMPASILLKDPNVGVCGALPLAFAKRQGKPYIRGISLAVAHRMSKEENAHKDLEWAKYAFHQARLALTQVASLLT